MSFKISRAYGSNVIFPKIGDVVVSEEGGPRLQEDIKLVETEKMSGDGI